MKIEIKFWNAGGDFVHTVNLDDGQGQVESVMVAADKWLRGVRENPRALEILLCMEAWLKENHLPVYKEMVAFLIERERGKKNPLIVV